MTRRCFIHVGTHKTGTTSIQHMLSGSAAPPSKGYYYPRAGQLSATLPGHHNIAWQLSGDPHFEARLGSLNDLLAEIKGRPPEHVILSSEDFSGVIAAFPDRFSEFVTALKSSGFAVTLIAYFRNHLDWLPRVYLTLISAGWDLSWQDTLAMNIPPGSYAFEFLSSHGAKPSEWQTVFSDYLQLLRHAHSVGADEVLVRQYDQRAACSDFLSVLGLTLADVNLVQEPRSNASPPLREFLLTFHRNRLRRDLTEEERAHIAAIIPGDETRIQLSPAESRRLLVQFSQTNRVLREDYGIPEPTIAEGPGYYVDELFTGIL